MNCKLGQATSHLLKVTPGQGLSCKQQMPIVFGGWGEVSQRHREDIDDNAEEPNDTLLIRILLQCGIPEL